MREPAEISQVVMIGQPCDECGGEGQLPSASRARTEDCWLCGGVGELRELLMLAEFRRVHNAISQPPRRSRRRSLKRNRAFA